MNITIGKDYEAISKAVAEHIIAYVNKKENALIELPGGDTPLAIFKYLIDASNEKRVDFSKCFFVSLDEWENLDYKVKGSCKQTLYDYFFLQLPINMETQVCFFDGTANLKDECARVDRFIFDHDHIDIAVLGIGMNGHIGFNEPGVSEDHYCTVVPLDDVTRSVSVKYFGAQLDIEHGITLGMKHFFEAKEVILIADSMRKADIIKKVMEGPITNEVPASLMRRIENCQVFIDEEAASQLAK